jgi:hypothetical protein
VGYSTDANILMVIIQKVKVTYHHFISLRETGSPKDQRNSVKPRGEALPHGIFASVRAAINSLDGDLIKESVPEKAERSALDFIDGIHWAS